MRNLLFLILIFFFSIAQAQQAKVNFMLRSEINKYQHQEKELSIIVRGDVSQIKREVLKLGGTYSLETTNLLKVKLLSDLITDFSKNDFVQSIECPKSNLKVLNDSVVVNNNVPPINGGNAPLINSYTGKGVIFGLIDTGLDQNLYLLIRILLHYLYNC